MEGITFEATRKRGIEAKRKRPQRHKDGKKHREE